MGHRAVCSQPGWHVMDSPHTPTYNVQIVQASALALLPPSCPLSPMLGVNVCVSPPPDPGTCPTNKHIPRWSKGGFEEASEGGLLAGRPNPWDSSPVTTLSPPAAAAGPAAGQQQAVLPVLQVSYLSWVIDQHGVMSGGPAGAVEGT